MNKKLKQAITIIAIALIIAIGYYFLKGFISPFTPN
jgi:hypothetical protein